jgi:hypothetical protein
MPNLRVLVDMELLAAKPACSLPRSYQTSITTIFGTPLRSKGISQWRQGRIKIRSLNMGRTKISPAYQNQLYSSIADWDRAMLGSDEENRSLRRGMTWM